MNQAIVANYRRHCSDRPPRPDPPRPSPQGLQWVGGWGCSSIHCPVYLLLTRRSKLIVFRQQNHGGKGPSSPPRSLREDDLSCRACSLFRLRSFTHNRRKRFFFSLRYHDSAAADGEATFRPRRYDGCVLSRWSTSGSQDPLEPSRLARLLARSLAQRHLLFSEHAGDGSTSALGEACALFRFNRVERYGSNYGTTPDVVYTWALPFWSGAAVKFGLALVWMSNGAEHCTVSVINICFFFIFLSYLCDHGICSIKHCGRWTL